MSKTKLPSQGQPEDQLDPRDVESLILVLKDQDEEVRSQAVTALGDLGDARGVVPLLEILQDKSEGSWVRSYAAEALGKLGDLRAVEPLIEALLNDRHGAVRINAATALGLLGDSRAVEALIKALTPNLAAVEDVYDTTELELTWYSAWSLAQLHSTDSVELLIRLLLESPADSLQRMAAIETLGVIGDERALPALAWVQEHERPRDDTMAASFNEYIASAIESIKQRETC